jgi:hypothetical protein
MLAGAAMLACCICGPTFGGVLKGGCGKVNITPPVGIPLIGSDGKPSDDILDDLYARALVLSDGNDTAAIVSADLLYTPLEEITAPVRRMINEKIGIAEENILVCATHTHSGPEVFTRSKVRRDQEIDISKIDQAYLNTLIRKIAGAALIAHKNMKEVKVGAAKGRLPEMVFNRRPRAADGSAVMTFRVSEQVAATRRIETDHDGSTTVSFKLEPNKQDLAFGPVDPQLVVLRVEDANDNIVASIVNYACHPVCVYPHLPTSISADYPGDVTACVERVEGGVSLFALGTAGNIVPYQRGLTGHARIGKAVGAEAVRRLQFVPTSGEAELKAVRKEIKFSMKKPADDDKEKEPTKQKEYITTEIQVLRIGDIYILGLPGEVLVEIGLEIKKHAGIEKLLIVSLANDAIGYVCHAEAYEEGGYESGPGTQLAKGAGEIMVREALSLIELVKKRK